MDNSYRRNEFQHPSDGPKPKQTNQNGFAGTSTEYGWRKMSSEDERQRRYENNGNRAHSTNYPQFLNDWAAYWPDNFEEFFTRIYQRFLRIYGQQRQGEGPQNRPESVPFPRFDSTNLENLTTSMVTDAIFYISQLIINFGTQIGQFIFYKISGFLYRSFLYIIFFILKYTVLAPILAPYYTARAYLRRAELIWRTSQSVWAFLCRLWIWWTGGQRVRNEMNAEIRSETGASMNEEEMPGNGPNSMGRKVHENLHANPQEFNYWEFAIWLLFYLPIVFSICWLFYHYYWPAWIIEKFLKIFGF